MGELDGGFEESVGYLEDSDERAGSCVVLAERTFLGLVALVLAVDVLGRAVLVPADADDGGACFALLLPPDFDLWRRRSSFGSGTRSCFDLDVRSGLDRAGEVRFDLDLDLSPRLDP